MNLNQLVCSCLSSFYFVVLKGICLVCIASTCMCSTELGLKLTKYCWALTVLFVLLLPFVLQRYTALDPTKNLWAVYHWQSFVLSSGIQLTHRSNPAQRCILLTSALVLQVHWLHLTLCHNYTLVIQTKKKIA